MTTYTTQRFFCRNTPWLSAVLVILLLSACETTVEDIAEISNQEELKEIAISHEDSRVRLAASLKIDDPEMLFTLAQQDEWDGNRYTLVEKLHNVEHLKHIASHDANEGIRRAALAQIDDEEFLFQRATTDSDSMVRFEAAKKISTPRLLFDTIVSTHDQTGADAVEMAIERLHDEELLAQVALNPTQLVDPWGAVADDVMKKIKSRPLLLKIAKETPLSHFAKLAIDRFAEKPPLMAITTESPITFNRSYSAQKLGPKLNARELAHLLTETRLYNDLLGHDSHDKQTAEEAVALIEDQQILLEITKVSYDHQKHRRSALGDARKAAVLKIDNQNVLAQLAQHDAQSGVRFRAAKRLTDRALRLAIARHDSEKWVRELLFEDEGLGLFSRPQIARHCDSTQVVGQVITLVEDKIIVQHYGTLKLTLSDSYDRKKYQDSRDSNIRVDKYRQRLHLTVQDRGGAIKAAITSEGEKLPASDSGTTMEGTLYPNCAELNFKTVFDVLVAELSEADKSTLIKEYKQLF